MSDEFDVIVIGGGAAGENAAAYARDNDLDVVLVERGLVGGTCSYWACMPSKALLRPGEALAPGTEGARRGCRRHGHRRRRCDVRQPGRLHVALG